MSTLFPSSTIPGVILLDPTTAAATITIMAPNGVIIPIIISGLAGAETVPVEIYTASGTWIQYTSNNIAVAFSTADNIIGFDIPGQYRLNKPVTASAVGIIRAVS